MPKALQRLLFSNTKCSLQWTPELFEHQCKAFARGQNKWFRTCCVVTH